MSSFFEPDNETGTGGTVTSKTNVVPVLTELYSGQRILSRGGGSHKGDWEGTGVR